MMAAHDDREVALKKGMKPFTAEWLESTDDDMKITPRYA
jgi:hypothetical protein